MESCLQTLAYVWHMIGGQSRECEDSNSTRRGEIDVREDVRT